MSWQCLSYQLLLDDGEYGKTNEFHEFSPITTFVGSNVNSFIRLNSVWNTIEVEKAFHKTISGNFGRSITCREGKSISKVSISVRTKSYLSMIEVDVFCHQTADWKPWEWGHIRKCILVSATGRLDSLWWLGLCKPWWVEVYVAESIHNLQPCHHGHYIHEPTRQWHG